MIKFKKSKKENEELELIKLINKSLKNTEKDVMQNKALNEYDKKTTLFYIKSVQNSITISKPKYFKCAKFENVESICKKIVFYNNNAEIYSNFYFKLKCLHNENIRHYKKNLLNLVRHLGQKAKSFKYDLGGM